MNGVSHRICIQHALAILVVLLVAPPVVAEDCVRAVALYNQSVDEQDLAARERLLKRAIPLCSDPEVLSRVYNNLADVYENSGRLSLALTYYKKALETKPDLATSYLSVGDIFFRLKDYYSTALMYEKGLIYRPDDEAAQKAKEEAELKARTYMLVYFDFDAFRIPKRYLKRLDVLAGAIRETGIDRPREVRVIGHTCDVGPREYNRRLSLRRAREVGRYLTRRFGEGAVAVSIVGKGEDAPMLGGSDTNARVLSRRVEITVRDTEVWP